MDITLNQSILEEHVIDSILKNQNTVIKNNDLFNCLGDNVKNIAKSIGKYVRKNSFVILLIFFLILIVYYRYLWYKENKPKCPKTPIYIINEQRKRQVPVTEYSRNPNYDVNREIRRLLSK